MRAADTSAAALVGAERLLEEEARPDGWILRDGRGWRQNSLQNFVRWNSRDEAGAFVKEYSLLWHC